MREIRLEHELKLKPVLLPRLVQLANLCSLNMLELRDFLYHEMENNIILEKKEKHVKEKVKERDDFDLSEFFQVFSEQETYYSPSYSGEEEEDLLSLIPAKGPSLYERLSYQVEFAFPKDEERKIALALIDYINKEGFLDTPLEQVSMETGFPQDRLEEIRKRVMFLDPVGVGAKDVREALLTQLESRKMKDSLAYRLVKDHFEDLAFPIEKLAEKTKEKVEDIKEALLIIKRLNPKPGLIYSESRTEYVVPEYVIKFRNNELVAEEVRGFIPEIRLNSKYLHMLEDKNLPSKVKKFLREYARRALTLLELLNERKKRIEKVINFIIEYQKDFLISSEGKLKPISQTEAAKRLDMPVSTLHRIITGKYIATPRGIFELKFFFPRGLRTKKGKTFDRDDVKEFIKMLIKNESPEKPLSDGEIQKILKEEKGIEITRREVCKLRKEMGIESYNKRKKKN